MVYISCPFVCLSNEIYSAFKFELFFLDSSKYVRHIFAITVFENYLYWTDWESKSVMRAEKYTGESVQTIYNAAHRPMDIHVYHPFRQKPCESFYVAFNNVSGRFSFYPANHLKFVF